MLVVKAMYHDPSGWGLLQIAHAQDCKTMFKPQWTFVTAMGKQSVVAGPNSQRAE